MRAHAFEHPWPGNVPLDCPRHNLDTDAITEPGRPTRLLISFDVGYHASGWWKNADYDRCLHISVSHPLIDRPMVAKTIPEALGGGLRPGYEVEPPTEAEVWAWALAIFGPADAPKAWIEPAASVFDPYRMPGIVHARLFYDDHGPIQPQGEAYQPGQGQLRPWSEKVLGSIGGDVR